MKPTIHTLFLLFFLCSTCFAQPKAVITGPSTGNTGDLVVLSTTGSIGDNFAWITPENLQTLVCGEGKDLAFSSGKSGSFRFILIATDREASIHFTSHTVVIGKLEPPKPPDPPDPPDPVSDLEEISRQYKPGSEPQVAALIVKNIRSTSNFIVSGLLSVEDAATLYQANISNALALRPRGSQADWESWRKAVEAEFDSLAPETVKELTIYYEQVARGLE